MDRKPAVDWSVARCRRGRHIALCALFVVSALGFSLRAEGDFTTEQDAGARPAAPVNHALQGPATEGFAVSLDELIDPLEDNDLGSERLDPPFFQAAESRASYGWRSARPDSRLLASSNPARGPPSS